jgi:hypothetical protein
VIRFTNLEVFENIEAVLEAIAQAVRRANLQPTSPNPSLERRGTKWKGGERNLATLVLSDRPYQQTSGTVPHKFVAHPPWATSASCVFPAPGMTYVSSPSGR